MDFPEEKTFNYQKEFQELPFRFRVFCDAECRCEHNIDNKCTNTKIISFEKPVSLNYYIKSGLKQIASSACYQYVGQDC